MQPYTNVIPFDPAFQDDLRSARPLRLFSLAFQVLSVIRQRRRLAELTSALPALLETLFTWQERASQRRHLASLDDRLLKDMGIFRADVEVEASKPFWRP